MNREEYIKNNFYFDKTNCHFCKLKNNKIIYQNKSWFILNNIYPYFNDNNPQLLVAPKRHIEFTKELTKEELSDFLEIEQYLSNYFNELWKDYFSFIRQSKSNKSVEHLHYHYLVWKVIPFEKDNKKYFNIK